MRRGTTMMMPLSVSSMRASPTTSRLDSGGITISSSPGYWLTHRSGAPRSTCPTSISKMVGRPFSVPLYCTAMPRVVVVDMMPSSTPPRQPYASSRQNFCGRSMPPRPR